MLNIEKETQDRDRLEDNLREMNEKLASINDSLQAKYQTKANYDRIIEETETVYMKVCIHIDNFIKTCGRHLRKIFFFFFLADSGEFTSTSNKNSARIKYTGTREELTCFYCNLASCESIFLLPCPEV